MMSTPVNKRNRQAETYHILIESLISNLLQTEFRRGSLGDSVLGSEPRGVTRYKSPGHKSCWTWNAECSETVANMDNRTTRHVSHIKLSLLFPFRMERNERVSCSECGKRGRHSEDCIDAENFPIVVTSNNDNQIVAAKFHDRTFRNSATGVEASTIFRSPRLSGFEQGRALLHSDRGRIWQKFPDAFETTLFSPQSASTPIRNQLRYGQEDLSGDTVTSYTDVSMAMIGSQATVSVLNDIPKFDGKARNFAVWRDKVELARPSFDPDLFLTLVRTKIGTEASTFLSGLGSRVDTVDKLIFELAAQYDEYAQPMFAHNKFTTLTQGTMNITDHHGEIYHILRGMDIKLETTNHLIKTGYVNSLSDDKLKLKLMRRMANEKVSSTLEDLMGVAITEHRLTAQFQKARPRPITVNAVSSSLIAVAASGSSGQSGHGQSGHGGNTPRRRENNPTITRPATGPWCPIHEVSTHDLADCKCKDKTACKYCKVEFPAGNYATHIAGCTARRCHECFRLGHIARHCKGSKRAAAHVPDHGAKRGRQDHGSTRVAVPTAAATLTAATTAAEPADIQTQTTESGSDTTQ